ncbi:hypothetical protein [Beijerinckia sp. L45]|uniref:hypothetical protein n=1 Tax=Beijerinckia sp. L45 TaxID=1641855 RepID=UPI00131C353E|nr:hypothetical protein [Beijerinckia sp. L45]
MKAEFKGLCWYMRDDYPKILDVMVDADRLPSTYDEFLVCADCDERTVVNRGDFVIWIVVRAEAFQSWCQERNLNANAEARALFATQNAAAEALSRHYQAPVAQ